MKTKTVVWVLIIISIFSLLWILGKNNISNSQNKSIQTEIQSAGDVSQLESKERFYDFGKISMKNGNVSRIFKITNNTDKDIFFPDLTTSCMCTKAYLIKEDGSKKGPFGMPGMGFVPKLNETIKAGQSADIEMVYDPNAHGPAGVGMIDRFAYLADDSGRTLKFEIKAIVTP